jgi:predicted Rossmann fold flavoprotein
MQESYDIIVIGGGPAGMMSAGRAGELGAKVLLIEKNEMLGKKLLITGGGRCNVTNAEFDNRKLLERFKDDGKYLFSPFSKWNSKDTIDFFNKRKMETKIENENRVFPVSNKSQSVWDVMVNYIKENNVTVLSNSPVQDLVMEDKQIVGVKLKSGDVYRAKSIIIATGGTSRPETGSTGDAFVWLNKIGHKIIEPSASLVPLAVKDKWVKNLAGVSLTNIKLTPFLDGIKQVAPKRGGAKSPTSKLPQKILFTHVGISGPSVLNMSKQIGELLSYGDVVISLDLLPDHDYAKLNTTLQDLFKINDKKKIKNSLDQLIPSSMVPIVLELSKTDPETPCNSITRESRIKLINQIKNIPINIDHLLGTDKAIVSSGGVSLDEVDWKTMTSKFYPNLYLVGDVLNIDRPSGGFSLQLCWTTGFVAGSCAGNTK